LVCVPPGLSGFGLSVIPLCEYIDELPALNGIEEMLVCGV
jgi:hypothetical protein